MRPRPGPLGRPSNISLTTNAAARNGLPRATPTSTGSVIVAVGAEVDEDDVSSTPRKLRNCFAQSSRIHFQHIECLSDEWSLDREYDWRYSFPETAKVFPLLRRAAPTRILTGGVSMGIFRPRLRKCRR